MLGLAFASVPLYRMFCEVTGFNGTTLRAERAPGAVAGQIGVRFDANIPGAAVEVRAGAATVRIAPGARTKIFYRARTSAAGDHRRRRCSTSRPTQAGKYFNKIECFCFTEQTLKAGQKVDMPVVFFVDPQDPQRRGHQAISTRSP